MGVAREMTFRILSPFEQLADHLQSELLRGRWQGEMPGVLLLEAELGVNRTTVERALRSLEKRGLLIPQGSGCRRRIVLPENQSPPALRIGVLDYDTPEEADGLMNRLLHLLYEAGHEPFFARKSLTELGMSVPRVARMVSATPATAWIVVAASKPVLEWFVEQRIPAFALFGRMHGLPIAGAKPDKWPAFTAAIRRLLELGHRRIVMLDREDRRKPTPGLIERKIFAQLEAAGIATGAYNQPDWEDSREGFHRCLDSLFRHTPPTALLLDGIELFVAAQQHLARKGIFAPEQVSLICNNSDPAIEWCEPEISHIRFDSRPVLRRAVRWADHLARGREDRRQTLTKAGFVEGGTIGQVPGRH